MRVEGEGAKNFNAVRLDSLMNANIGPLLLADEDTGEVVYNDRTGTAVQLKLGSHAIRILPR